MSDVVLCVLGWIVVGVTLADVFRTVLWSDKGAGPVTAAITSMVRRMSARSRRSAVVSAAGPVALLLIISAWAVLLLVGFTLVLEWDPDAIRTAVTERPSDAFGRAYYVGFTLFTLGMGDLVPTTDWARAVTVLMNAVGMFLVTLSVTYLLPVISASVKARSFSSSVLAIGETPEEIVIEAWDGQRVQLEHQLRSFASEVTALSEQQLAYPVLHLFRSPDHGSSTPRAVAVLDDVLTMLDAVPPSAAPPGPARRQLRSAIGGYLASFRPRGGDETAPSPPDLDALAAAGIPLERDQAAIDLRADEQAERRAALDALVQAGRTDR